MQDLEIALVNRPGSLAEMGEALGRAGVSIEGGGVFVTEGNGFAHFPFADGAAARRALEAAGIPVLSEREVVVQRLRQAVPGQLGQIARRMADAGVNIEDQYSDHDNRLISSTTSNEAEPSATPGRENTAEHNDQPERRRRGRRAFRPPTVPASPTRRRSQNRRRECSPRVACPRSPPGASSSVISGGSDAEREGRPRAPETGSTSELHHHAHQTD